MRYEVAPHEQLKFLNEIEALFLKKIVCPILYGDEEDNHICISDESLLTDFCDLCEPQNAHGEGSKPGTMRFRFWKINPKTNEKVEHWIEEVPTEPRMPQFIAKTKEIFGVDITPVSKDYMPIILHYISAHMPDNIRSLYFKVKF